MTQDKKETGNNQSMQQWMTSDNLFEEHIFFYLIFILPLFFLGINTLGFELEGYSLQQNLLFNFIWYLTVCLGMGLSAIWYRLIFGKNAYLNRERHKVTEQLKNIEADKYKDIYHQKAGKGQLPPNRYEYFSLIFLWSYILFDFFYVSSWVKDSILVWQPDWLVACADVIRGHINLPPVNEDKDIFWLSYQYKEDVKRLFPPEAEYVISPMANTGLFYHFWHLLSFIPVLVATLVFWWKPMRWFGMDKLDPRYIDGKLSFVKACAWSIVMGFLMVIFILFLIISVDNFFLSISSEWSKHWVEDMKLNGGYLFIAFGIRFFYGWLVFWKNKLFK